MKQTASVISDFFQNLGLTEDETLVYTTLSHRGSLTPLELSRITKLPRTRIYRIIEMLKGQGIAEEILDEHRSMVKASDTSQLETLVNDRKHTADRLLSQFPIVSQTLTATISVNPGQTKVQFYRGKNGLRQMAWHTLRARGELVGFTYRDLAEVVGSDFINDWRHTFTDKGMKMRDIYSVHWLESIKNRSNQDSQTKGIESRYIDSKILDVQMQIDIYNDVIAQYTWHEGEIFGVEIYNPKTAAFHRQIFEIVWNLATSIKKKSA
jgi:sugar-specific transcriptional regulator TrmB